MSTPRNMMVMRVVDSVIQIMPVLLAFALLLASIYEVAMGGLSSFTVFAWPFIGVLSVSSVTVILYTSFYLYTFYHFDYLLAHVRVVAALAFTVLGMAFTSLTFSTTLTSATIYSCIFFIVCVVLWYYNRRNRFFKFPFSFVALVIYYAFLLVILIKFSARGNLIVQAITKYVGAWIWSDLYQKRGDHMHWKRGGIS